MTLCLGSQVLCFPVEPGEPGHAPPRHAPPAGNSRLAVPASHTSPKRALFRGSVRLDNPAAAKHDLHELSGLAWAKDEQLLYTVSDRGYLVCLRPEFEGGRLRAAHVTAWFPLRDAEGRPLRDAAADSEGLELLRADDGLPGNSLLLVSFERDPRVCRYSPTGTWLGCELLPDTLADINTYASANKALEALALHPVYGLLSGAEHPRPGETAGRFTLYGDSGARWSFPLHDIRHGALVGLSVLPDGQLLALERSPWSILHGFRIAVHLLELAAPTSPQARTPTARSRVLLTLGAQDTPLAENFEGIAVHDARHFFMISDDNGMPFQKGLLYYFQLPQGAGDGAGAREKSAAANPH